MSEEKKKLEKIWENEPEGENRRIIFPKIAQWSDISESQVMRQTILDLAEISVDTCDRTRNASVGIKSPSEEGAPLPYL